MTAQQFDDLSWSEKEAELMRAASEASADKHKDWKPPKKQDADKSDLFRQEEEETESDDAALRETSARTLQADRAEMAGEAAERERRKAGAAKNQ